ncbi:unnamed protein product, partial [Discosporangium mesarthrocarpum]
MGEISGRMLESRFHSMDRESGGEDKGGTNARPARGPLSLLGGVSPSAFKGNRPTSDATADMPGHSNGGLTGGAPSPTRVVMGQKEEGDMSKRERREERREAAMRRKAAVQQGA